MEKGHLVSASDTRRRFLATLPYPISAVPITSPYLDPQMFSLEEKMLSLVERGRVPSDQSLK
jgi:hypothetical protein